ncbi:hypothetical protein SASPL_100127 [Salvia splendens]|uniref:E3 ubiquitin-protein ligase RNF170 n=1 Tax=Salvia splendens TaxID=180675 RepID=A0A8X9AA05_SALSN|nr:hypothetical protein SASPL_100127 [Salvia splendens]
MDGPPVNDECSICQQNFQISCQANCGHWFCVGTPPFSGRCILQVWDFGHALRPCKCPLCRREITLLVPSEAHRTADGAEILLRIEHYNRQFGAQPNSLMQHCRILKVHSESVADKFPFLQRMQDLPFLLRRLSRDIMDPQRALPLVERARVYLAVKLSFHRIHRDSFCRLALTFKLRTWDPTSRVIHLSLKVFMILSAMYVVSPVDIIPEALLGIIGLLDDLIVIFMCFLYVAALYRTVLVSRHGGA